MKNLLRQGRRTPARAGESQLSVYGWKFFHFLYNPVVTITALCVLVLVGTAACLLPARRVSAVDPMQALRAE
jgi:ABC-type antimicrobial peptide transport system permease subunit